MQSFFVVFFFFCLKVQLTVAFFLNEIFNSKSYYPQFQTLKECVCLMGSRRSHHKSWIENEAYRFRSSAFIFWLLKFSGGWTGQEILKWFTAARGHCGEDCWLALSALVI